jgi:hypothetical protein
VANQLPKTAAIAARLVFVQSCPQCRDIASGFAAGCVADPAVTSVQLIASLKGHCHDLERALPADSKLPTMGDVQSLLLELDPVSDTSGTLGPDELPNGFDAEYDH